MRALPMVVCLSLVCAGCTRVDPLHTPVAAADPAALSEWQRRVASRFLPGLQQEFADALQEIRFSITAQQEATGHDAIASALCKHIDGRTVNEVVLTGCELKLQRLEAERSELRRVMHTNTQLLTKPGDRVGAEYLDRIRGQQQKRLDAIDAEMQVSERRVAAHGGTVRSRRADAKASASSDAVSRDEALKQIAVLLQERRDARVLRYGAWPVKIDREGKRLDETERSEFRAKQAATESGGRLVIPVGIKGHWLFFEGPNEAPQLPGFILANLTETDRRKFKDDWVNLEAELWARKSAADLEIRQNALAPPPPLATGHPGPAAVREAGEGSKIPPPAR